VSHWITIGCWIVGILIAWRFGPWLGTPRGIFSGARFYFWAISPFVLLFTWGLLRGWSRYAPGEKVGIVVLIVFMWLLVLALYRPGRSRWAGRLVAGSVSLAFIAYFLLELVFTVRHGTLSGSHQGSMLQALLGVLFVGIPTTVYALSGMTLSEHAERVAAAKEMHADDFEELREDDFD